ncbi:MAG: hypothetical protein NTV21_10720 [Planctomycetota bacterium]|nr:hypothetical protein [Planctomycetota bacterium]
MPPPSSKRLLSLIPDFVEDRASIGKPRAEDSNERRAALQFCLGGKWAAADVARLERIDDDTRKLHGWAMWRR